MKTIDSKGLSLQIGSLCVKEGDAEGITLDLSDFTPSKAMGADAIVRLAASVLAGPPDRNDKFTADAESMLYQACIFYLLESGHETVRIEDIEDLIAMMLSKEGSDFGTELDALVNTLPADSKTAKIYSIFRRGVSFGTQRNIAVSCLVRLGMRKN